MRAEVGRSLFGLGLALLGRCVLLLEPERSLLLYRLFPIALGHRLLALRLGRHRHRLPFECAKAEATATGFSSDGHSLAGGRRQTSFSACKSPAATVSPRVGNRAAR